MENAALSLEKEAAPPLSEDNLRSTKKVRIRAEGDSGDSIEVLEETDILMAVEEPVPAVSYRNKLINNDKVVDGCWKQTEVVISKTDYRVAKEGEVPSIEFSNGVRELLAKGMERSLIVKLLGRYITYWDLASRTQFLWQPHGSYKLVDMEGNFYCVTFDLEEYYLKVLTGGPWMIYGAYLTVQPWTLNFDSKTAVVSKVVAWVRIPGLSIRYYHKSTLRAIGTLLGDVVKIDYMTETRGRAKYARIAVLIDLLSPLVLRIKVDGTHYGVEYEGLPHICFTCGKYGHMKDKCPRTVSQSSPGCPQGRTFRSDGPSFSPSQELHTSDKATSDSDGASPSPFGSWMQVRYPRKGNKRFARKEARIGDSAIKEGSRYNVLFDYEDTGAIIAQDTRTESKEIMGKNKGVVSQPSLNQGDAAKKKRRILGNRFRWALNMGLLSKALNTGRNCQQQSGLIYLKIRLPRRRKAQLENVGEMIKVGVDSQGGIDEDRQMDSANGSKGNGVEVIREVPSVKQPTKVDSSLDSNNHTVMILQQARQALEDLGSVSQSRNQVSNSPVELLSDAGGGKGKENKVHDAFQKRQSVKGVKLQAAGTRNLKVRKKVPGVQISKDALGVIREELDLMKDPQGSHLCSMALFLIS
ncbi:hypothetical protein K1719_018199 [Acacia pycnantha]|nr:hypothetical protein K1719_018199 [Acacia pycnantha]